MAVYRLIRPIIATGVRIPLKIIQQGTVGQITTTYELPKDLTSFKVVGRMRAADFFDCLTNYYMGSVTLLNLWDATEADFSAITTDEIEKLAHYSRNLAELRKGGKTAIVFDAAHDFGLGKMLQTLLEIAGLPLDTYVCRSLDDAWKWLGVGCAMIVEIEIDNDNKIIRRSVKGDIHTDQALKLVQNVSLAAKLNQGYNILIDIQDTSFRPKMADLLEIAAECSKQLIGFNRKIAFLIPNTEQRKQVATLFRTCMEAQGLEFKQFFEYDEAMEWLTSLITSTQATPDSIQKAS